MAVANNRNVLQQPLYFQRKISLFAVKLVAYSPQPQCRVADVKYLFAIDGIEAVFEIFDVVFFHHFSQIAIGETHAFDLFAAHMFAGAVGNAEPAFAGTVDHVEMD